MRVTRLYGRFLPAIAAAVAPAPLVAQTTQPTTPPPTIDACYVPISGTIYRIDTQTSPAAGAPRACLNVTHVRFTWNQQGPAGPAGPSGPPGPPGSSATIGPDLTLPGTLTVGTASTLNGLLTIGTPTGFSSNAPLLQLRDGPSGTGSLAFGVTPAGNLSARTLTLRGNATINGTVNSPGGFTTGSTALLATGSSALGFNVTANGPRSTAIGAYASTNSRRGATVIGDDATTTPLLADVDNEFAVRASGGVRLRTSADLSKGCNIDGNGNLTCSGSVSAGAPTQHAALGGLGADDHPQYLRTGGTRAADGPLVIDGTTNPRNVTLPSGPGTRFIYDPRVGALRSGRVSGNQFSEGQLGQYSFAAGQDVAAGTLGMALGNRAIAGNQSLALGVDVNSARGSTVIGHNGSSGDFLGAMVLTAGRVDFGNMPVATAVRDEELLVRAPGGIRLRSNRNMQNGCDISSDAGTLDCSGGVRMGNSVGARVGPSTSVSPLASRTIVTSCPAGTIVIGGGVATNGGDMKVRESFPDFANNRFVAQVRNDSAVLVGEAAVSAVCIKQ